jgi:hypothetical protein
VKKTIDIYTYEIASDNTITMWVDGQEDPSFYQPYDPRDGEPFSSQEDAVEFIELHIKKMMSPVPLLPNGEVDENFVPYVDPREEDIRRMEEAAAQQEQAQE